MIALSCTTVITVVQICIQRGLAAGVRYFILAHMYKIINFIWGGREGKEVTFHETFFFFHQQGWGSWWPYTDFQSTKWCAHFYLWYAYTIL